MSATRFNPSPPTAAYGDYFVYQGVIVSPPPPVDYSGYLATSLGRPAGGGSGSPRPLTGWLWPRT